VHDGVEPKIINHAKFWMVDERARFRLERVFTLGNAASLVNTAVMPKTPIWRCA